MSKPEQSMYETIAFPEKKFKNVLREMGVADPRAHISNTFPVGEEALRLEREFNNWRDTHPKAEKLEQKFIQYLQKKLAHTIKKRAVSVDDRQRIRAIIQEYGRAPLETLFRAIKGHAVLPKPVSLEDITIEQEFNDFVRENSLEASM